MPNWAKINLLHRGVRNSIVNAAPGGGSSQVPDSDTLYSYPLQNSFEDATGNSDASLVGTEGVFVADAGPFGAGDWAFDGSQDTTPQGTGTMGAQASVDLSAGNDFCIEAWFYMPSDRTDNQFQHIFDLANAGFTNEVSAFQNDAGGSYGLGLQGDGILDNVAPVAQNTWHHFVAEYNAITGWIQWAHDGVTHGADNIGTVRDSTASVFGLCMGNTNMGGDNKDFQGYIAHARISRVRRYEIDSNGTYTVPTEAFPLEDPPAAIIAPSSIDGMSLHLDATVTASITEDGNGVSSWVDQSANGNDVGQTDNLQKPITSTVGGMNVITFDRAAEALELASGSVTGMEGPDITVFAVVNKRYAGEGGIYPGVIARQAGNWSAGWRMAPDNSNVQMDWAVSGYTREAFLVLAGASDTGADGFHIYVGDHKSSTDTSRAFQNGYTKQTNTDAGVDLAAGSYNLDIGNGSPDHSRGLFGSIGELIVYDSVLSDADRFEVTRYLQDKWR